MAMWKLGRLALAAVLTAGSAIGQASAMPVNGLASPATAAAATNRVQGRPLCVRTLSLLVEAGPLLLRSSLLQLLCRAAASLVLAPTPLVVGASVRAVTTLPHRFA
jgi:hypothetical protein